jgi:RNA polymerase sigma-70 factor (ECF subfamily)
VTSLHGVATSSPNEEFRETFDEFFPRLKSYFRRWGFSPPEAEDLSQVVLMNVYKGWDRFRGEGNRDAWIYAAARNAAVDAFRRSQRRGEHAGAPLENAPDLAATPDESAESREQLERTVSAMRALPAGMRTCLLLQVREGLSYQEVGERLSLSVHTVKVQIWNARRRLKGALGKT